jgi:CubicO group peptidase (beta-lactamase class C family)
MRDTKFESGSDPVSHSATSYFPRFAADPTYGPDLMGPINLSCYAGAGAFVSTSSDLVRFAMAVNSGKLLKPATVQMLQASQRLTSGEETGYGLGWDLETATLSGKPTRVVGHDGDLVGGRAVSFMTFTEHGIVVAVLSNTSYADTFDIAVKIAQAFTDKRKD